MATEAKISPTNPFVNWWSPHACPEGWKSALPWKKVPQGALLNFANLTVVWIRPLKGDWVVFVGGRRIGSARSFRDVVFSTDWWLWKELTNLMREWVGVPLGDRTASAPPGFDQLEFSGFPPEAPPE